MNCKTMLIKPSHPDQGDFVVINEFDFDPTKHVKHELPPPPESTPAPSVPPPPELTPAPSVPPPPVDPLASLPANWKELSLAELRPIVEAATGRTPETQEQAVAMIGDAITAKAAPTV